MIEFGQGDTNNVPSDDARMSDFVNEARYIDLAQELTKGSSSYHDFEGLTASTSTEEMLDNPIINAYFTYKPGGTNPIIRDLLAHWFYDNVDEGGYTPSIEECQGFIHILDYLFTSRYWMKTNATEGF
jgi:hypothetical protein